VPKKPKADIYCGRTTNRWVQCDLCSRTMQLGDLFVNIPYHRGEEAATVACVGCVRDIGNSVDEYFRSEDANFIATHQG